MSLLDAIKTPADVRALPLERLPELTAELRGEILKTISKVGGHLSSNLGSVELTVALHYVYDTPNDRLVWDVGHQAYAHKMLTGRRERFSTLRRKGGLSGFPCRSESEYDAFGTAHASTSLSAALGMAIAARRSKNNRRTAAIIGDGALSGGMAFEALNNAGVQKDIDLLVVLNDNEMSISPAVGAINNYLGRILASRFYGTIQRGGRKMLSGMPAMQQFARRAHEHIKGMVLPGTMFEEFGFNYVGPIDGHDVILLVKTLRGLRDSPEPQFLHVVTVKGKGFEKAENDPVLYHGVGAFEPSRGIAPMKVEKNGEKKPTYADVFGDWLLYQAKRDERLIGITPAMREGSGMNDFAAAYPDQYFDVGIAEQHAVTFAAGLACEDFKPVVAIYSTFLQRAYDQLIHDVALQNLPVVFAIDRGGLVGADGATHHGAFDLSYLRCIPNMIIMTPADENLTWKMLNTAYAQHTPAAVRYPRGTGTAAAVEKTSDTLPLGKGEICRRGKDIALLVFGAPLAAALIAAEELNATVVDMRFVKPLDEALIKQLAAEHELLVSIEENVVAGGAGSAVGEFLRRERINTELLSLGLPDQFISHGAPTELLADCGLDAPGIQKQIRAARAKGEKTND